MSPCEYRDHRLMRSGFTLLEMIVAIVILTIAMSIAFNAFTGTIHGWKRGTEVLDAIEHGDFAMGQLASALNSTIYFTNPRKVYAFRFEKSNAGGLPTDMISFVTASGAFMPDGSPYVSGPHRIRLFIDDDEYGDPALFALPMPAIADEEEFEDAFEAEPILVSRAIRGLEILFWDKETEDWSEEWTPENSIPERIHLSLFYVADEASGDDPVVFSRVIEPPVYESLAARLSGPTLGASAAGKASDGGQAPTPAPQKAAP